MDSQNKLRLQQKQLNDTLESIYTNQINYEEVKSRLVNEEVGFIPINNS
jgi:hypothetical protein